MKTAKSINSSGNTIASRSRKSELGKKSSTSQSRKREAAAATATPKLNSTSDLIFSVFMLSITPLVFMLKYVYNKAFYSNVKTFNNGQNVTPVDCSSDGVLLRLNNESHVLTSVAGGCHVMEYLLSGSYVTAVDEDMYQIALLELKTVSAQHLPFDQYFEIFGQSNIKLLRSVFSCSLRPHLSAESALYWNHELPKISSFIYAKGSGGYLSWFIFQYLLPFIGLGFIKQDLLANVSAALLRKKIRCYKFRLQTLAYLVDCLVYRFGLCVPSVLDQKASLGMQRPDCISVIIDKVFFQSDLVEENYLISGYILGRYTRLNAPAYLREDNYAALRAASKENRLTLVHGTLISAITQTEKMFSAASLLNSLDVMTDRETNELLTHLIPKMDPITGRVLWRSLAKHVHAAPLALLRPKAVIDNRNLLGTHWSTWVADVAACPVTFESRQYNTVPSQGVISDVITGLQMISFCLWKPLVSGDNSGSGLAGAEKGYDSVWGVYADILHRGKK